MDSSYTKVTQQLMLYQKQPGIKGSCNYELVGMIKVC